MQVNGWKVVTTANMAVIFFIFGVTLDTSELMLALKAWKAIVFGLSSILVLTPIFGFFCMLMPFKPYEFALGLAIMACVPTSLSSGVTLVIGAYGNGALALLFTVSGSILGIITAPLAVKIVLGSMTNAKVDSVDLLVKLGVSILMPVVVGKTLRELIRPVGENVYKYKAPLYLINNLQITMIVWQKLSSAREVLVEQEIGDVLMAGELSVELQHSCQYYMLSIDKLSAMVRLASVSCLTDFRLLVKHDVTALQLLQDACMTCKVLKSWLSCQLLLAGPPAVSSVLQLWRPSCYTSYSCSSTYWSAGYCGFQSRSVKLSSSCAARRTCQQQPPLYHTLTQQQ
eukprot:GHUV01020355.1.p1 GENE.GHUV01020355.1~~GHUV01020355.1.p1  ORF type:complete len:342 (+),score=81.37 GHUV01020355.1:827-1852(+)